MQRILITGANRGIGFELLRQYIEHSDDFVFASCRNPQQAEQLKELAERFPEQIRVLRLDINNEASIAVALDKIADQTNGLDLLINNAGIHPQGQHQSRNLGQLSIADVSQVLTTNAVCPLILTQACRKLLKAGDNPRVVMISSGMGSLTNARGDTYAYRMSKAAMNMAARVLAFDQAMAGIITVAVHPGWVQTDMGGPSATLTPQESASGLRALSDQLTGDHNGKLYRYDGNEMDW